MKPLVFQTDFGLVDGAVSAMYGVAYTVSPNLKIHDLTHDITPFNIWEASYRLIQTINYWPEGTVFVSVVDPGVGSARRSIAVKTTAGQYIITPDNGTLTHIKRMTGIAEAESLMKASTVCRAAVKAILSTAVMSMHSPAQDLLPVSSTLQVSALKCLLNLL